MKLRHTLLLSVLVAALGCTTEPAEDTGAMTDTEEATEATTEDTTADAASEDAAVRQVTADYAERFNAGDMVGVAELFIEEGVLMPTRGEPAEGRGAIEAHITRTHQAMPTLETSVTEIKRMGEGAVGRGLYTLTGEGSEASGEWMASYEKGADGAWRLDWLMVNEAMSMAAEQPAAAEPASTE